MWRRPVSASAGLLAISALVLLLTSCCPGWPGVGLVVTVRSGPYRIAYSAGENGSRDVVVINDDGSGRIALTSHPLDDFGPQWSPDGRRLAFVSSRDAGSWDLYVVDADGTDLERLTTLQTASIFFWGRSGDIVFVDGSMKSVYLLDPATGGLILLRTSPATDWGSVNMSPDGRMVSADATIMSRDGTVIRVIPGAYGIVWSPDPNVVAYKANSIFILNLHTNEEVALPESGNSNMPCWSPNGRFLAISSPQGDSPTQKIRVYDVAGNLLRTFDNETVRSWAWSTDGSRLAVVAHSGGDLYLATLDVATGEVLLLDDEAYTFYRTASQAYYEPGP